MNKAPSAQYRCRGRQLQCGCSIAAAVAGRPARAAASFGWPCQPRVCCSRSERGGRSPAPRGRRGPLSSTTTASLGRARRARWADHLPQHSAPALAHRSALMLTAPTHPSRTAGRPGDRARSRQPALAWRCASILLRRSLRASCHASRAACSARSRAQLSYGHGLRPSALAAPARGLAPGLLEISPPSPSRGVCAPRLRAWDPAHVPAQSANLSSVYLADGKSSAWHEYVSVSSVCCVACGHSARVCPVWPHTQAGL